MASVMLKRCSECHERTVDSPETKVEAQHSFPFLGYA